MVASKVLIAKVLEVTAEDKEYGVYHSYTVLEFENGLIAADSDSPGDWYFPSRREIEPYGCTPPGMTIENVGVKSVIDTGRICEMTAKELLASIQEAIKLWGIDSVPAKHRELWAK